MYCFAAYCWMCANNIRNSTYEYIHNLSIADYFFLFVCANVYKWHS